MPTITEKTVREIALETPSSIRVFEALGIDYCCGGKKPLSDACSHANVDFGRVQELLEQANRDSQAPAAQEWRDKPLGSLIAHIVAKHHGLRTAGNTPNPGSAYQSRLKARSNSP